MLNLEKLNRGTISLMGCLGKKNPNNFSFTESDIAHGAEL